jgi:hypothetical protein
MGELFFSLVKGATSRASCGTVPVVLHTQPCAHICITPPPYSEKILLIVSPQSPQMPLSASLSGSSVYPSVYLESGLAISPYEQ